MDKARKPVRFRALLEALVDGGVDFVVVGGVAAVLEGVPVSTFDLDVVYANNDENLERIMGVLQDLDAVYVDPSRRSLRPDTQRLSRGGHHLLRTKHGRLDVLAAIGAGLTFEDLLERTIVHQIHGIAVPVLRLEAIIQTKQVASRPKDRAVLDLLRQTLQERTERENGEDI